MPTFHWQQVLDFWFSPTDSPSYLQQKPFWYGTSPAVDAHVRKHLGAAYDAAQHGALDAWTDAAEGKGALALILLLDQVPRNIFRGTPQAYSTDAKAVSVARYAVGKGWDRNLHAIQRRYMYSPFNHSESLEDQEMSLRLFTELGDEYHLRWARDFYEQVKRDGRFKHRDEILGR
ncbi:DUF924 family protein [Aspergillus lucknowensis]|uniref:DUF924-domain-containing protein n=1 Tax=Aspergillus lucknowensis TaxID=176173 RepID=A0ABR4LW67_9EURO